jgi:predicted peptidase
MDSNQTSSSPPFLVRRILLLVLALLSIVPVYSQEPEAAQSLMREHVGQWMCPLKEGPDEQPFLAFLPNSWDGKTKLPLIIHAHGSKTHGEDLHPLRESAFPTMLMQSRSFDALVLCPLAARYWRPEYMTAFLDQAQQIYAGMFDPDRVYLVGESAGAAVIYAAAKVRADVIAAMIPIAPTKGAGANMHKLINIPIWAFHNENDPIHVVEGTRERIAAIQEAGGRYAFYTEYSETPGEEKKGQWPDAHPHAWLTSYHYEPLWEWLFQQRRGNPERAIHPMPTPLSAVN